ncbi:hypothetical protein GCM10010469_28200 [Streptomyces labedae]|uniref:Uncharacterized protein n=1 Tax=Streptomyces labedae TaxID=285569 RepID=A0ABP6QXI1_9ACTN
MGAAAPCRRQVREHPPARTDAHCPAGRRQAWRLGPTGAPLVLAKPGRTHAGAANAHGVCNPRA